MFWSVGKLRIIFLPDMKCVSFWYHMHGAASGSLNLYVKTTAELSTPHWSRHGTQGSWWKHAAVSRRVADMFPWRALRQKTLNRIRPQLALITKMKWEARKLEWLLWFTSFGEKIQESSTRLPYIKMWMRFCIEQTSCSTICDFQHFSKAGKPDSIPGRVKLKIGKTVLLVYPPSRSALMGTVKRFISLPITQY